MKLAFATTFPSVVRAPTFHCSADPLCSVLEDQVRQGDPPMASAFLNTYLPSWIHTCSIPSPALPTEFLVKKWTVPPSANESALP